MGESALMNEQELAKIIRQALRCKLAPIRNPPDCPCKGCQAVRALNVLFHTKEERQKGTGHWASEWMLDMPGSQPRPECQKCKELEKELQETKDLLDKYLYGDGA